MKDILANTYVLTDDFDTQNLICSLIEVKRFVEDIENLIELIRDTAQNGDVDPRPETKPMQFTVGNHVASNEIYIGPIDDNGSLQGNSQKRTMEVLLAVARYIEALGSNVILNDENGVAKFALNLVKLNQEETKAINNIKSVKPIAVIEP